MTTFFEVKMMDYGQFIVEFGDVPTETKELFSGEFIQPLGEDFSVIYSKWENILDKMYRGNYPYYSIPKLYTFDEIPFVLSNERFEEAIEEAGISQVKTQPVLNLRGSDVIIGIIGPDFDISLNYLRYQDGSTRFEAIWDQTSDNGNKPVGFIFGSEYDKNYINEALAEGNGIWTGSGETNTNKLMKIICGSIQSPEIENRFEGIAPASTIVAVKIREADSNLKEFYGMKNDKKVYAEADIMASVSYIYNKAMEIGKPVVILINCNGKMGGHTGRLPLDIYVGRIAENYGTCIISSTGPYADKRSHYEGSFLGFNDNEPQSLELRTDNSEGVYVEIWAESPENYSVSIISPSGEATERIYRSRTTEMLEFVLDDTIAYVDNIIAEGRDNNPLIIVKLLGPSDGVWTINVYKENIINGNVHSWLTSGSADETRTYFLNPNPYITLNDVSTTENIISVSSYNPFTGGINVESGRGFTRNGRVKPDFAVASIRNAIPDTSAAVCAGAAALYMEWAIIKGNAPAVRTGEIKSFFIAGTIRDRNERYPSEIYGYGKMNLYDSFEEQ